MGNDWESILGCDGDDIADEYENLVYDASTQAFDCDDDDQTLISGRQTAAG